MTKNSRRPDPKTRPGWDLFWRYAAERQSIYWRRLRGDPPPRTSDPVLAAFRFTNVYRATDRVSQFLINHVQDKSWDWPDTFVRTLLFKLFNRPQTWQELVESFGQPNQKNLGDPRLDRALEQIAGRGSIYNPAYIMPPPRQYSGPKHRRHLQRVRDMDKADVAQKVSQAASLVEVFETLKSWPSLGDFLAYQLAIDLNYSTHLDFDEDEFVVAGPGAQRGLKKCFAPGRIWTDEELIRYTAKNQEAEFARRNLGWLPLPGRRLKLIDVQNIFCEVDKYSRLAMPGLGGPNDSQRPKQNYRQDNRPLTFRFPSKWEIGELKNGPGL